MKISKKRLVKLSIISLMLFALIIIYIVYINFKQQTVVDNIQTVENIQQVCFKQANMPINKCFSVEIAQTAAEREKGLMFREELNNEKGMLFIFPQSEKYGFWMKNTLIPLDIIWIDENKTIVDIKENAMPCKVKKCEVYYPDKEALYVLEINAGLAKEKNLSVGDKVDFVR